MTALLSKSQRERVARSLESVPFGKLLGLNLEEIEPGSATLSMAVRDELKQNNGVVHGGAIASIIDSATAFAIIGLLAEHERVTTVDLTINYLRPVVSGTITAKARVVREGGRIIVTAADAFDSENQLVATALSTYFRFTANLAQESTTPVN